MTRNVLGSSSDESMKGEGVDLKEFLGAVAPAATLGSSRCLVRQRVASATRSLERERRRSRSDRSMTAPECAGRRGCGSSSGPVRSLVATVAMIYDLG